MAVYRTVSFRTLASSTKAKETSQPAEQDSNGTSRLLRFPFIDFSSMFAAPSSADETQKPKSLIEKYRRKVRGSHVLVDSGCIFLLRAAHQQSVPLGKRVAVPKWHEEASYRTQARPTAVERIQAAVKEAELASRPHPDAQVLSVWKFCTA